MRETVQELGSGRSLAHCCERRPLLTCHGAGHEALHLAELDRRVIALQQQLECIIRGKVDCLQKRKRSCQRHLSYK